MNDVTKWYKTATADRKDRRYCLYHTLLCVHPLLADTGLLASKLTQIVQLCTTDLTDLVDLDIVDSR